MNLLLKGNWLIIVVATTFLLVTAVKGQNAKVSPKLDFDDKEDDANNSTDVPILTGIDKRRNESRSVNDDANNSNNDSKSRPKIHGVRVTVDTGDNQKTKESKESVEISSDSGKHKKRVGIHTDITFEITGVGDDDNNATNRQRSDDDKEDASVPIFKGRGTTQKPRKPHDSRHNWSQPNFSAERRSYDTMPRSGPGYSNYYPQYPNNVPIYTGSRTDGRDYRRRDSDGWISYVPSHTYWTTERTYNEPYRPNTVAGWKPCYCVNPDRRRRDSPRQSTQSQSPQSSSSSGGSSSSAIPQNIDSKLESPFAA